MRSKPLAAARALFPFLADNTYLNTAAESLWMISHHEALETYVAAKLGGERGREPLYEIERNCRVLAARLFECRSEDIAFLASTARGIDVAIKSMPWTDNDNIVMTDLEYPTNLFAGQLLQRQGVEVRLVQSREGVVPLADLMRHVDTQTRAVLVSAVSFRSGYRWNLQKLYQALREKGVFLIVDAVQAAGVTRLDAGSCDFMVAGTYKWLLGSHGLAVFYVNPETADTLNPAYVGWRGVQDMFDPERYWKHQLLPDSRRFEEGMPNYLGLAVLQHSLAKILELGVDRIAGHVGALTHQLVEGLLELGIEWCTPRPAKDRAGIVCFSHEYAHRITSTLAERRVFVWGKDGTLRVSSHFYNSKDDIVRFLEELKTLQEHDWFLKGCPTALGASA